MAASSFPGLSPVADLRVREGESVKKGQILAVLENKDRLETAWKAAEAQAHVAEMRLAQVRAGADPADLAAAEAEVAQAETRFADAQTRHERNQKLYKAEAIPAATLESTAAELAVGQQGLNAARQRYRRLSVVRDVDLAVADAQYQAAQAEADHAKAELGQAYILAPADGLVVKIHARAGEVIGATGLLELAEMPLYVLAEVREPDIARVKIGQKALITGVLLDGQLEGVVEEIGLRVGKNQIFGNDPAMASDLRTVEVKVRLNKSAPTWIDARVTVVFP
jgi:HlyD family secretion protein